MAAAAAGPISSGGWERGTHECGIRQLSPHFDRRRHCRVCRAQLPFFSPHVCLHAQHTRQAFHAPDLGSSSSASHSLTHTLTATAARKVDRLAAAAARIHLTTCSCSHPSISLKNVGCQLAPQQGVSGRRSTHPRSTLHPGGFKNVCPDSANSSANSREEPQHTSTGI